jgi:hypothetical protein
MKNETANAKVVTAYGKPQPKDKQEYTFEYRVFESVEEATNAEFNFLELANEKEKANKRSAAYQEAIAWAKPDPNARETVKARMIKDLVKLGKTQAEAEALVASV